MNSKIKIAENDSEIEACFAVMCQLRPHLAEGDFLQIVRKQMEGGYYLVYLEDSKEIKSVAGFRFINSLSTGTHMFVDDFVTEANNRSRGYGSQLFDRLVDLAKTRKCKKIRLDSGVQRFGAHRFYLNKGMSITCHHFDLDL